MITKSFLISLDIIEFYQRDRFCSNLQKVKIHKLDMKLI